MNNFAFCTMTYGEKYLKMGDILIKQLNDLGGHVFVLTDSPNHYEETDLLTVVKYSKDYFSFHEKKTIMKECLKHYETAIFLDADVVLMDTVKDLKVFENIEPGIHILATFGNLLNTFVNDDVAKCENLRLRNAKYGQKGINFLEENGYQYKKTWHGIKEDYLEHYLEGKWMLKKDDGKEVKFFEIWDNLAIFTEEMDKELGFTQTIGAGEGGSMSIAAHNSGIRCNVPSLLCGYINQHFISNYQEKMDGTKPWNIAG